MQQKHYSELIPLWRRGCNEIELCLIYDFVSVFKKTIIKFWKFRNNWTCRAGVINRMIVQELSGIHAFFVKLVTKQPDCIFQKLHCVTSSSEYKYSGKLTPYSQKISVSELHCHITYKTLKLYWTALLFMYIARISRFLGYLFRLELTYPGVVAGQIRFLVIWPQMILSRFQTKQNNFLKK